jgi:hypothetical protein
VCADFRNHKEELKNALVTSRSKIHGLEGKVREIEAGGLELKRAMKEATESEYAVSQKLAYETTAHRALKSSSRLFSSHCIVTKSPLQGMRWS